MRGTLLSLLAPRREITVTVGAREAGMRIITAAGALEARREAAELGDMGEAALVENACVLARALYFGDARMFETGRSLLNTLTAGEIEELSAAYAGLAPAGAGERELPRLVEELGGERFERLKWRVQLAFKVLPSEARAREMTDADYLLCAMHLRLDDEETLSRLCPDCRERAMSGACHVCGEATGTTSNPEFDMDEYLKMKGGAANE